MNPLKIQFILSKSEHISAMYIACIHHKYFKRNTRTCIMTEKATSLAFESIHDFERWNKYSYFMPVWEIQATLVNSTMLNSILSLTSK